MRYRFEQRQDWTHFSSGRVLHNYPGAPAFPARLASELFQRCAALLAKGGRSEPYTLYDPCCGGAHLLTVIGLLHGAKLAAIMASDVEPQALEFAAKNLALLDRDGLQARRQKLIRDEQKFGKPSHADAVKSADWLRELPLFAGGSVQTFVFAADAAQLELSSLPRRPEIMLTDLPYGHLVQWQGGEPGQLLAKWAEVIQPGGAMAVVYPKKQRLAVPPHVQVEEALQVGHRRLLIMTTSPT